MVGTAVVPSDGMRREFEIAQEKGLVLLPIGATGSIAKQLADDLLARTTPGGVDPAELSALASPVTDLMTLVTPIVETIGKIREGK
ncbi:hypothetical protein A5906_26260 [Bradyrhizobium sacchari]|nr:hypothetical protein A5906_26260 [Bradyrhizobium sacchari]